MFKNLFRWRKPFITTKDELSHLSETEQAMVRTHRESLLSIARGQVVMERQMEAMFTPNFSSDTNQQIEYMTDFFGVWQSGNNIMVPENNGMAAPIGTDVGNFTNNGAEIFIRAGTNIEKAVGQIVPVKPIDVLKELELFAGANMIEDIDAKIAALKIRKGMISSGNQHVSKELIGMELRLENRKKWDEFKDFYSQFENTTTGKIQDLINKYKLVFKGSDLFISSFPDEAINIMKEYKDQTVKLCGKQPYFYVIAEESSFKEEYRRKDPILTVQCPFGAYWQVLGAWDKEMILLEEL